jgi:hypothetical protein
VTARARGKPGTLQLRIQLQTPEAKKPARKKCAAKFPKIHGLVTHHPLSVPGLPATGLEHFEEGSAIRSGPNGR